MNNKTLHLLKKINTVNTTPICGRVSQAIGLVVEGHADISAVGEVCEITPKGPESPILAEVVGFRENKILMMPLGELNGIGPGSAIHSSGSRATAAVGQGLLGRVIDGLGFPLDGHGPLNTQELYPLYAPPPNPLERRRISHSLDLGIRAINSLFTCGRGQRMGIFAGSGVGKSVLLGMISRYTEADVNVIALIGERGREVKEFIEKDLGEEGLKHSVVIVASSEKAPLIRQRGAFLAMTIAEYFRDQGKQVLLMMDSLTRLAHAQREIGLAIGEPPTTKGYTPSVFAMLPRFLERAGTASNDGTITGLYTVLVEGDDLNDPIPDAARSILDGHIVLSREIAARNQYPAIDILNSTSRVMIDIVDPQHLRNAKKLTDMTASYQSAEDLIHIGAYKSGSNAKIDESIERRDDIQSYLRQDIHEKADLNESLLDLRGLFDGPQQNQKGIVAVSRQPRGRHNAS
ncbi:MAG: FliI/YscN family ATPase [Nitrospiria bacterium]